MIIPLVLSLASLALITACRGAGKGKGYVATPYLIEEAKSDTSSASADATAASTEPLTPSTPVVRSSPSSLNKEPALKDALSYVSRVLKCSASDLHIVGGTGATDTDLVSASTFRIVFDRDHYCTASLVGKNHMITAAHCLEGISSHSSFEIEFGVEASKTPLRLTGYKLHPDYRGINSIATLTPEKNLADIAVVTFEGDLTDAMIPVPIAAPGFIYPGMPVVVAGFGSTSAHDSARRPLAWLITELTTQNSRYKELQIKQKTGKGACYGDSGGPTFIVGSDAHCLHLIGSISGPSRGTSSCDEGGALSMDLTRYRSWIGCAYRSLNHPLHSLNVSDHDCKASF